MSLPIKTPSRDRYNVQGDIIRALGGADEVAGMLRVAPVTVRKAMEDPDKSGQDITVKNLQKLLAVAGQHLSNLKLQGHVDELLQDHFLNPCHRRVYLEDQIFQAMDILQNGRRGSA